jgi:zinc transporter ZupT
MDEKAKLAFGAAAIVGGSIVAAAFIGAPPKYSLAATGQGVAAYKLDLSTGAMFFCTPDECQPVASRSLAEPQKRPPATQGEGYLSLDPQNSN